MHVAGGSRILSWNVVRQPGDEIIHGVNLFRLRSAVLLRPAIDLAREVTPGLAVVPKTDGAIIDPMEGGDDAVCFVENGGALRTGPVGHPRIPQDATRPASHDVQP